MGLTYVNVRLTNTDDLALARGDALPHERVRSIEVPVCVDTGAVNLCITTDVASRLGLRILGCQTARLANDAGLAVDVAGPVEVEYGDRSTTVRATVVPGATENLLGAIPLEDMDLVVHPAEQKLVPAHPEGPIKPIKRFFNQHHPDQT